MPKKIPVIKKCGPEVVTPRNLVRGVQTGTRDTGSMDPTFLQLRWNQKLKLCSEYEENFPITVKC